MNPEYLVYRPDQGISSFDECKRQLRLFGEEIVPRYLTTVEPQRLAPNRHVRRAISHSSPTGAKSSS